MKVLQLWMYSEHLLPLFHVVTGLGVDIVVRATFVLERAMRTWGMWIGKVVVVIVKSRACSVLKIACFVYLILCIGRYLF